MAHTDDVADEDARFALAPDVFVAAGDGLARRLRAAGDREAAAAVRVGGGTVTPA